MLTLRAARPADALDVAGVHVRSWQAGYRGLLPDDYLDGLRAEDRAARYTFGLVGPEHPASTVAVEGAEICGFVTTVGAEVRALYVDPKAWGRGAGRTLIEEARSQLWRRGFAEAVLWVFSGNDRAERFYTADGWLPTGVRREDEVWGIRVQELGYRRALP